MTLHDTDRTPFWTVWAIFDPDGEGGDFSYTAGLHDAGMPELWLAARPSLGEDPGLDWMLSQRDTCHLLNELAWEWLDGRWAVGASFERTYDGGLATLRFRVDPPEDKERLEALGCDPEAQVVPIRWSLHRPLPGSNEPMTDEVVRDAGLELARLGRPEATAPAGWEIPATADWSPAQRFGPRTPLVLARAAQWWTAEADDMSEICETALEASSARMLGWALASIRTCARAAGRHAALEELEAATSDLVAARSTLWLPQLHAGSGAVDEQVRDGMADVLDELLRTTLGAELVGDLLAPEVRLASLGILVACRLPLGTPAGPAWCASTPVRRAVDELVDGFDRERTIALAHALASDRPEAHLRVSGRLRLLSVTTAAAWAPLEVRAVAPPVRVLGSLVSAALTHRARLTADEVTAFAEPYAVVLPGLEALLNRPL